MPWRHEPSRCAEPVEPERRRFIGGAFCVGTGALTGCSFSSDTDHKGDDAPREMPLARVPRVAWVLSSGGPRGFTHVGVLRALHEMGLTPDLIVGASVGALVGSLRASGLPAPAIEAIALDLQPWTLARVAIGAEERLSGGPLAELVRSQVSVQQLERMPIAMACVASRKRDGRSVAFTAGDVGLAVQASAAIEGQFAPVRIRGETYVDADAVSADLVLKPDFGYWVNLSRDFRERAIAAGYRDTMAKERELRAVHRG